MATEIMKKRAAHYYRRITESLPQSFLKWRVKDLKRYLKRYILLYLVILFVITTLYAAISYINYETMKSDRQYAQDSFNYWQEVAASQSNSPDAYFQAGYYAYLMGDSNLAVIYLSKAIELDPGFDKAKALKQQLDIK